MSHLNVLEVSASGRRRDSVSRTLTGAIIATLQQRVASVEVVRRDLSDGIPLLDAAWIAANFTAEDERSAAQRATLATSDALVAELQRADVLVIGAPIYNFGVPAALKAWVDMIARARKTFRYTSNGPEGLLQNKTAFIVVASGGVAVDSPADFATPYLRHALRFVGITDVHVIAADRLHSNAAASISQAHAQIESLLASKNFAGQLAA
ncbi:MAG: NAD(P)H-dependent oxidoreductase [Gammaproteobacteria bacterium]|nr:NAD(P)H-dependent oxidoreductase [Gammaproteobacteria bacterium]MDH5302920.1 NAD(P)H-dependent oxidoreductase [Gammaproteobacteria bacterium]MDH5323491.1 NAD(P)H-dependent oxidoreductase [Gammaproteobacteria bacterium]